MTGVVYVPHDQDITSSHDEKYEFKIDIQAGLKKPNKQIQSKYFYDEHGSLLFNQITRHPDYYLTRCEIEILNTYKKQLSTLIHAEPFNLIELGPGEGIKTQLLMEQFLRDSLRFTYIPIDISTRYLKTLITEFKQQLPDLKLIPVHSDYFRGLTWLSMRSERRNFVLFLGSSIGNFEPDATAHFLRQLWEALHHDDYVLLGFDLRKDVNIMMRAYNDADGITRDFNLNLLQRINRELSANFDLTKFRHYATYNVYSGAMESYLISLESQTIHIEALEQDIFFEAIEPIHVEYSYKYHLSQIQQLAHAAGFEIIKNFADSNQYFVDSLWRVKKLSSTHVTKGFTASTLTHT
jgi:L-histidine Nalpha-methyltransferase